VNRIRGRPLELALVLCSLTLLLGVVLLLRVVGQVGDLETARERNATRVAQLEGQLRELGVEPSPVYPSLVIKVEGSPGPQGSPGSQGSTGPQGPEPSLSPQPTPTPSPSRVRPSPSPTRQQRCLLLDCIR
jgi:hypothetical protein